MAEIPILFVFCSTIIYLRYFKINIRIGFEFFLLEWLLMKWFLLLPTPQPAPLSWQELWFTVPLLYSCFCFFFCLYARLHFSHKDCSDLLYGGWKKMPESVPPLGSLVLRMLCKILSCYSWDWLFRRKLSSLASWNSSELMAFSQALQGRDC